MSALNAMQLKNSTLEKNLSDETRVKLDLFSALGEAKRQLEIRDSKYHIRTVRIRHVRMVGGNIYVNGKRLPLFRHNAKP